MRELTNRLHSLVQGLCAPEARMAVASVALKHAPWIQGHRAEFEQCFEQVQLIDLIHLHVRSVAGVWSLVDPELTRFADFLRWARLLERRTLLVFYNIRDDFTRKLLFLSLHAGLDDIKPCCPKLRMLFIDKNYSRLNIFMSTEFTAASQVLAYCHPTEIVKLDDRIGVPDSPHGTLEILRTHLRARKFDDEEFDAQGLFESLRLAPPPTPLLFEQRDDLFDRLVGAWQPGLSRPEAEAVVSLCDLYGFKLRVADGHVKIPRSDALARLLLTPPRLRGRPDGWNADDRRLDQFNAAPHLEHAAAKLVTALQPLPELLRRHYVFLPPNLDAHRLSERLTGDDLVRAQLAVLVAAFVWRRNAVAHGIEAAQCAGIDALWGSSFYVLIAIAPIAPAAAIAWPAPAVSDAVRIVCRLSPLITGRNAVRDQRVSRVVAGLRGCGPDAFAPGVVRWSLLGEALAVEYDV